MGNLKDAFSIVTPPNAKLVCRGPKPTCNGVGAACFDPRFIGGDGIVFYFHGKSNQHFSLVSDVNLQPISLVSAPLEEPGTSHGSRPWVPCLALTPLHFKPQEAL
ncbi:hypothetical protein PVL29_001469 [Vitis rotundifolia]|uniref:Uncharacterized protein n=1 Tax=Vitis rotundifolia TaxID=103349 RepID=A0AA39ASK6_VITRO|nr:hypothetical protein PVL29_001469 [Vitis rotundifolia]